MWKEQLEGIWQRTHALSENLDLKMKEVRSKTVRKINSIMAEITKLV